MKQIPEPIKSALVLLSSEEMQIARLKPKNYPKRS